MTSSTPTAYAVSPDSGEHWAAEGAWPVADGIFRIPLPLPMDALKAVNVYVIQTDAGLVLVDGGWAIPAARDVLDRSLASIGAGYADIKRFLVTHVHRDHYSLAVILGRQVGAEVALGIGERPSIDAMQHPETLEGNPFATILRAAGAPDVAAVWDQGRHGERPDMSWWQYPDVWLDGDHEILVGRRTLDAVQTPGHTPGHFVFADQAAGLLFAGDHVLPTITPSIGFTFPLPADPLGDFMASLTKVRGLPDLTILPAHGPVAPSTHARIDELLAHHEHRLDLCLAALADGRLTSAQVATQLGWTRHETAYDDLDVFSRGMAAMETKAHLELLVARGLAVRSEDGDGAVCFAAARQSVTVV